MNEILGDYSQTGIWQKVYALTNRPLSLETSKWLRDHCLSIIHEIDLLKGTQEDLEEDTKAKIEGIESLTHVYHLISRDKFHEFMLVQHSPISAYKASADIQKELQEPVGMFQRSVTAVNDLSPVLEFVILQVSLSVPQVDHLAPSQWR